MEYWCWWIYPNIPQLKSLLWGVKSSGNFPPLRQITGELLDCYWQVIGYNFMTKHAKPQWQSLHIPSSLHFFSQRSQGSPATASPRQPRNHIRFLPKRLFWLPRSDLWHLGWDEGGIAATFERPTLRLGVASLEMSPFETWTHCGDVSPPFDIQPRKR